MFESIRSFQYAQTGAILIVVILAVIVTDLLSQ